MGWWGGGGVGVEGRRGRVLLESIRSAGLQWYRSVPNKIVLNNIIVCGSHHAYCRVCHIHFILIQQTTQKTNKKQTKNTHTKTVQGK